MSPHLVPGKRTDLYRPVPLLDDHAARRPEDRAAADKSLSSSSVFSLYGTNVPAPEVERLFATFDSNVVGQFLAIIASMKLISDAPALAAVIATIKTAILVIADAFGKKVVVAAEVG
jgi:hypothetical protein